jgi:hypothetical protein
MATDKQTEANRRNAQKSTGPTTAAGKARSSRNALKTGIHAELLVIYDEKAEDLQALVDEYYTEYAPVTPQERFQVDTMIQCEWFCRRYTWVEAQVMYEGPEIRMDVQRQRTTIGTDPDNERMLTRLGRRLEATRRAYKSATHEFERLREARLAAEAAAEPEPQPVSDPSPQPAQYDTTYQSIGFVPSQPDLVPPAPTDAAAPKSRGVPKADTWGPYSEALSRYVTMK